MSACARVLEAASSGVIAPRELAVHLLPYEESRDESRYRSVYSRVFGCPQRREVNPSSLACSKSKVKPIDRTSQKVQGSSVIFRVDSG